MFQTNLTVKEITFLIEQGSLKALKSYFAPKQEAGRWLNLKEFCEYIPQKPSIDTAYGWIYKANHGEPDAMPPMHKRGKKIFFMTSEVNTWLRETGRKKATAEQKGKTQTRINKKAATVK